MSPAATGDTGLALFNLETLIASSAAFRTWTGTANVAAARDRIYYPDTDDDDVTRPAAFIGAGPSYMMESKGGGEGSHVDFGGGAMGMDFEANVTEDDPKDAFNAFANEFDAVIVEMNALAGTSGFLNVRAIRRTAGPARSEPDEGEEGGNTARGYDRVEFEVDWGP